MLGALFLVVWLSLGVNSCVVQKRMRTQSRVATNHQAPRGGQLQKKLNPVIRNLSGAGSHVHHAMTMKTSLLNLHGNGHAQPATTKMMNLRNLSGDVLAQKAKMSDLREATGLRYSEGIISPLMRIFRLALEMARNRKWELESRL